jgi:nucleoside-diphosphate-sugar epimerase
VYELPIGENAAVVSAAEDSYAGRKRAMEIALLEATDNATVIRPGGIHGPYSSQPREWFYMKRILDGRRVFVHGFGGRGSLHPTSVANLAEMIRLAAITPGSRILNSGDPHRPDERSMAAAIAAAMGRDITQVLLPGVPEVASPWSLPSPFFLSTEAAERDLGYRPVTTYEQTARSVVEWIQTELEAGVFQDRLDRAFGVPGLGAQVFVGKGGQPFDYALEDQSIALLQEPAWAPVSP